MPQTSKASSSTVVYSDGAEYIPLSTMLETDSNIKEEDPDFRISQVEESEPEYEEHNLNESLDFYISVKNKEESALSKMVTVFSVIRFLLFCGVFSICLNCGIFGIIKNIEMAPASEIRTVLPYKFFIIGGFSLLSIVFANLFLYRASSRKYFSSRLVMMTNMVFFIISQCIYSLIISYIYWYGSYNTFIISLDNILIGTRVLTLIISFILGWILLKEGGKKVDYPAKSSLRKKYWIDYNTLNEILLICSCLLILFTISAVVIFENSIYNTVYYVRKVLKSRQSN